MNVLKWLEQVRKLDELINAKLAERDRLMELATQTTQGMDGMPHGSGVSDKVGNAGVKLADMTQMIDQMIDQYVDLKRDVVATLEKLPAKEYGVLHRMFIRYMTYDEISAEMDYSVVQIWRIKNKGLQMLEDVVECKSITAV